MALGWATGVNSWLRLVFSLGATLSSLALGHIDPHIKNTGVWNINVCESVTVLPWENFVWMFYIIWMKICTLLWWLPLFLNFIKEESTQLYLIGSLCLKIKTERTFKYCIFLFRHYLLGSLCSVLTEPAFKYYMFLLIRQLNKILLWRIQKLNNHLYLVPSWNFL